MDVLGHAAHLREARIPHVLATVVKAREPSSGKPGDRVVITGDGRIEGWVGGACAESIVADQALAALKAGRARYLVLDADATGVEAEDDRITHPLQCHSGGAIELFVEPFTPPVTVEVVGDTPVARTLVALCAAAGYDVRESADPDHLDPSPGAFVVVATMGRADEVAARAALLAEAPYVAVVASRRRADALREWLRAHDVSADALEALHSPAGLDLGAKGATGVAISILAELASEGARLGPTITEVAPAPARLRDPVCGMQVDPESTLTAVHDGEVFAFCNPHCREAFVADPARYATSGASGPERVDSPPDAHGT